MYDSPKDEERVEDVEELLALATRSVLQDDYLQQQMQESNTQERQRDSSNFDKIDRAQIGLYEEGGIRPIINQNSVDDSLRDSLTKDQLKKYED